MSRSRGLRAALTVAAVLAATPLRAQEPADTTRTHVVRPGDTLWDLARRYLGDPFRWSEIFQINRERVDNPHLIFPDWRLLIPGRVGRAGAEVETPPPPGATPAPVPSGVGTTVFSESARVAARRLQLAEAEAVPVVTRGDFYRAGLLVPESEVVPVGRLAELVAPSVVPVAIPPQIGLNDRVFLSIRSGGSLRVEDRLHLLRPGRRVERLGRIFESTGVVRVVEVHGEVATVVVEEMFDVVRVGDVAVPLPDFQPLMGPAEEGAVQPLEGRLLAFERPHPLQNLHDLAFVDLGAASGVEEGDELVVVLPPERKDWGLRPEVVVARLRVVRAAQRTASVKVIELEHPALQAGLPVRLVAKMR